MKGNSIGTSGTATAAKTIIKLVAVERKEIVIVA